MWVPWLKYSRDNLGIGGLSTLAEVPCLKCPGDEQSGNERLRYLAHVPWHRYLGDKQSENGRIGYPGLNSLASELPTGNPGL